MKLSDTLALTGATLHATLGQGRLNIETLSGKALGGTLDAVLSLTAKDNAIAAQAGLALAGAELSALANPGTAALVTGQASLSLKASGQGLSPRGLISVLRGRGAIRLTGGQLSRLTPYAVQTRADDLLAQALPLTEDAITKSALEAVQSKDFKFHKLIIPVTVADGTLDIRRASFRDGDATVRMEAYIDLNKALVDSTWQMGVSSDRRMKWPPVKIVLAGPLRELGARPRTLAADDFVRALQVRKMEGDISRLESLNRPAGAASAKAPAAAGLNPPASLDGNATAGRGQETEAQEGGDARRQSARASSAQDLRAAHARRARQYERHRRPLSKHLTSEKVPPHPVLLPEGRRDASIVAEGNLSVLSPSGRETE